MNEIFKHKDFVLKEEVVYLHGSTDVSNTIRLETENEIFTYTFVYGNLISFVRCKK